MNDFEKQLRAVHLDPPSAQLDCRMEQLLALGVTAPIASRPSRWWWLALPAAGVAAAFFLLPSRHPSPLPSASPLVYQLEPQGLLRESLLASPAESQTPPAMIITVQSLPSTIP
jgi:hypothetical protein